MTTTHDHELSSHVSGSNAASPGIIQDNVEQLDPLEDTRHNGNTADEYFNQTSPTNTTYDSINQAYKSNANGRSRRSRDHTSTRDLVRLLVSDGRDQLRTLHQTSERLEFERNRANEAERQLQEANERCKTANMARTRMQEEVTRANEELRLYKAQLDAAQNQLSLANDMITQADKDRLIAEEEVTKAKKLLRQYQEEKMVQQAKDEGRRLGREEGRREGRDVGFNEAYEEAYSRAREEVMGRLDDYLVRSGLLDPQDRDAFQEEMDEEFPADERRVDEPDRAGQITSDPSAFPQPQIPFPNPQPAIQQPVRQHRRVVDSAPPPGPVMPDQIRAAQNASTSSRPKRSNSFFARLRNRNQNMASRLEDPNVEINYNAPDVASIFEDAPVRTLATPLPPSSTDQPNYAREPSPVPMPVPDFNPNPSDVRPISVYNRTPSPVHPHVDIPPDGYIPNVDKDGNMTIPPPHELSRQLSATPMTSPRIAGTSLPPSDSAPVPPPKSPNIRNLAYEGDTLRASRYQRSVAGESVASTNTSNLSILSPPGTGRQSTSQPRLNTIPEYDGRSPHSSFDQMADNSGFILPQRSMSRASIRSRDGGALDMSNIYQPEMLPSTGSEFTEHRQRVADELRDPNLQGNMRPVGNENFNAMSPRSGRSAFSFGPRRPSQLTTPAPLAPSAGLDQAYIRPRRNSGASDAGYSDIRSVGGGGDTAEPGYRSRTRNTSNSLTGEPPEINVVPPSRSESLQSRRTYIPQGTSMSPNVSGSKHLVQNSGRSNFETNSPSAPFRSLSRQSFNAPTPLTPVVNHNIVTPVMTEPIVPNSGVVEMPPGFFPNTPGDVGSLLADELPSGFVLTAHENSDMPSGFIPNATLPDIVTESNTVPPGFMPMPTSFSVNTLPDHGQSMKSPISEIQNALPVIPRRAGSAADFYNQSTLTPRVQDVALNDASAKEWSNGVQRDGRFEAHSPRPVPPPAMDYVGYSGLQSPRPVSPRPPGIIPTRPTSAMSNAIQPSLSRAGSMRELGGAGPSVSLMPSGEPGAFNFGMDPTLVALPAGFQRTRSSSSGSAMSRKSFAKPVRPVSPGFSVHRNSTITSNYQEQQRPISPRPQYSSGFDIAPGLDPASVPVPSTSMSSFGSVARSNSHNSYINDGATRSPRPGMARSFSTNDGAVRSPALSQHARLGSLPVGVPISNTVPVSLQPGLPPTGLSSPFSHRLQPLTDDAPVVPNRNSIYTLTTTPGRPYGDGNLPSGFDGRPVSPARTTFSVNSHIRGVPLPASTEGNATPRSSRIYPRTPGIRASTFAPSNPDIDANRSHTPIMDRPMTTMDLNPMIRRVGSRSSISSRKSYKSFNKDDYVDPAILASGESRLLGKAGSSGGYY